MGLSGSAHRGPPPGVTGRRPVMGFLPFPSTGYCNPGGALHQDLRSIHHAEFGSGFRRTPPGTCFLSGCPSAPGHPLSEPPGYPEPFLGPAVTASNVAQAQHWIYMGPRPVHSASLQPRFHHQFVAPLHRTAPDGPALGLPDRIAHLGFPALPSRPRVCPSQFPALGPRPSAPPIPDRRPHV